MAQTVKGPSRPRQPARRRWRRSGVANGSGALRVYGFSALLDKVENLVAMKGLPPGVEIALVAETAEAEQKLRDWKGASVEPTGHFIPIEATNSNGATIDTQAYEPDARSRALLRGLEIAKQDLADAGGAFELAEVVALLHGISRQRVEKRVKEGSLFAVPGPSNRRRYPTFQFTKEGVVEGLSEVQAALPTRNPWAVLNFFVQPDDRLGGRKPIDVLKAGDVSLVVSAAQAMGHAGG